ncbi:hypothetical protein LPUS_06433 [Lasallia pustulata]|uniref:Uncharacterized protein n=1 Tax=Lasallia pustulata TaxID=136370 RepID=A0A1W5D170_9LECA|nr:hypothetical protein LPUS_06433 [Lasallia pustulata]
MATKIRIQSATDKELVDKCKEETDCGDCNPMTLVVDVSGEQGVICIVNKEDNKNVDDVGPIKEGGNLAIVPWKNKWWYYAIGSVHVAHVQKKS